jgi:hypothetical protein
MLRLSSLLAGLALTLAMGSFMACSCSPAPVEVRKGHAGESCARTDDCAAPLVCIALACAEPSATSSTSTGGTGGGGMGGGTGGTGGVAGSGGVAGTGGAGAGGSGGVGGTGGSGGSGGSIPLDPVQCALCLDEVCMAQKTACNSDCLAIEACIEALCSHLSVIGSGDEGPCQVHCQQLHLAEKAKHLAVVNCAQGSNCPPCSSYPFDHDACVTSATEGVCAAGFADCNASMDCVDYRDCVATCATLTECLACDDSPSGQAGAPVLLVYQQCVATECIAESWLK